jgi:hypothetical protein
MVEIRHQWIQTSAKSKGVLEDNQGAIHRLKSGARSPWRGHNTRWAPWTSLYLGKHRLITPYLMKLTISRTRPRFHSNRWGRQTYSVTSNLCTLCTDSRNKPQTALPTITCHSRHHR